MHVVYILTVDIYSIPMMIYQINASTRILTIFQLSIYEVKVWTALR